MAINGINPINNYNDYMKISTKRKTMSVNTGDTVDISQEAMTLAETKKIIDMVKKAPDVRADRVAEVSEKLKDPNYIDNTLISSVADKLMDLFQI